MIKKLFFLSVIFLSTAIYGWTQTTETEKKTLDNGTVEEQFDYVMTESNRYQEYKVVKMTWLETLKSHVLDSMKVSHKKLADTQRQVNVQRNQIDSLKTALANINENLDEVNQEKDSIDFMGAQMQKSAYKSLMWIIIFALLALLLFFIYRFKRSNDITVETRQSLAETQNEFEAFKKRAREKEQVLKRELQDELNKRL